MGSYYTIDNEVSIPSLHPVTHGKLDELAKRYQERYSDDSLNVTSMTRDPKVWGDWSPHSWGYGFDIVSNGLGNDPERRAWLASEAKKLDYTQKTNM